MKMVAMIFVSLMTFVSVSHAAPYYTGVGCNKEGTHCIFGRPSGRVLNWSKKGTVEDMGERCEKFIANIEAHKNDIAKHRKIDIRYKNFTYFWSRDIQPNGRAKIVCNVEIHSELPNVKIEGRIYKNFYWTCENESNKDFTCHHTMSECEAARAEAEKGQDVLDATIYMDASLLQGVICTVATAKVK